MISAKFVPLKYYTLSSQLRRLTSFSVGLFGSANSVTRSYPVMRKSCIGYLLPTVSQCNPLPHTNYTYGSVLAYIQTEEFEMHASTKIIVVTGLTTELHAGRQRVHFSILQPFLLTTSVTIAALRILSVIKNFRKLKYIFVHVWFVFIWEYHTSWAKFIQHIFSCGSHKMKNDMPHLLKWTGLRASSRWFFPVEVDASFRWFSRGSQTRLGTLNPYHWHCSVSIKTLENRI